jgi:hypothetical protein
MVVARSGPKTETGKRAVRQNATTHGIFSNLAVIPGVESEDEWREHLQGVITSYEPKTHMEVTLVEQIALALWRMRRVAWFELSALELSHQGFSVEHGSTLLADVGLESQEALAVKRRFPEEAFLKK